MKIEFIGRNCEVNDHLKDVMEKKLEKLDKYFSEGEAEIKATLKKQNNTSKTEIMLDYQGSFIRAEVSGQNFYDNVDKLLPKIEGQIRKYRTKWDKNQKNSAFKEESVYGSADQNEKRLVKDKHFKMVPMTIDQAVEQLELLGHSFFVYIDAKTNQINVLYMREDGDLGLIETHV